MDGRCLLLSVSNLKVMWLSLASSSDGTRLVVAVSSLGYTGSVLLSNNGGLTWWAARMDNLDMIQGSQVAMSSDGMTIISLAQYSRRRFALSVDGGSTWQQNDTPWDLGAYLGGLVTSSDGLKLATFDNDYIYTSDNGGLRWRKQVGSGGRGWFGMVSSADGNTLMARKADGYILVSRDSGNTWTEQPSLGINACACMAISTDGEMLVAAAANKTFISTDGGATSQAYELNNPPEDDPLNNFFISLASSGTNLAAIVASPGKRHIYISPDFGRTWTRQATSTVELDRLTISADGARIAAIPYIMYSKYNLFRSADGGATWDPPLP